MGWIRDGKKWDMVRTESKYVSVHYETAKEQHLLRKKSLTNKRMLLV